MYISRLTVFHTIHAHFPGYLIWQKHAFDMYTVIKCLVISSWFLRGKADYWHNIWFWHNKTNEQPVGDFHSQDFTLTNVWFKHDIPSYYIKSAILCQIRLYMETSCCETSVVSIHSASLGMAFLTIIKCYTISQHRTCDSR